MATTDKSKKVVPLFTPPDKKESEKKWGKAVMDLGYCIFPAILLQAQSRLLVTPQEMTILLQLAEHWWKADNMVFPSKATTAQRVGLSAKQVQRHIKSLEDKKLVKRIDRFGAGRGRLSNQYDFAGLVRKLKEIAPDITKAKKIKAGSYVGLLERGERNVLYSTFADRQWPRPNLRRAICRPAPASRQGQATIINSFGRHLPSPACLGRESCMTKRRRCAWRKCGL